VQVRKVSNQNKAVDIFLVLSDQSEQGSQLQ
jgi:hypothetical protein